MTDTNICVLGNLEEFGWEYLILLALLKAEGIYGQMPLEISTFPFFRMISGLLRGEFGFLFYSQGIRLASKEAINI
jgi:hypothetical protein